jgi:hypothetical protein
MSRPDIKGVVLKFYKDWHKIWDRKRKEKGNKKEIIKRQIAINFNKHVILSC